MQTFLYAIGGLGLLATVVSLVPHFRIWVLGEPPKYSKRLQ